MVKAVENTPKALLAAMKAGEYYSSTGPEINSIRISDTDGEVDCSAAATVIVQGQGTSMATQHGKPMITAPLSLDRLAGSPWIRITVVDRAGKRAYSNPIWGGD